MRRLIAVFLVAIAWSLACGGPSSEQPIVDNDEEAVEGAEEIQADADPAAIPSPQPQEKVQKGVHVGGEDGVIVGRDGEEKGVEVGGEYGVQIGKQEEVEGVRVGGEKGVMVGKDDENSGVRVGGQKGVIIDGKKGISIGGKKIIGKKKDD